MHRMKIVGLLPLAFWLANAPALADEDDVREMQRATATAKVSLAQAIEIAQREVPGGKAVEAELKWRRGGPRIEVEILTGEMWKDIVIDAVSGKVISAVDDPPDTAEDRDDLRRDKENSAAATVTPAEALATAEKETSGGKPVEIELTTSGGKPVYKVELLAGDKLVKRHIPATTQHE